MLYGEFILVKENHNIFCRLNPEEYRQVLGNIKHCILATDLALFFPNKARLGNILREKAFSWDLPDHRWVNCVSKCDADSRSTLWIKSMLLSTRSYVLIQMKAAFNADCWFNQCR